MIDWQWELKQLILESDISMSKLASELEVSKQYLSSILNGSRELSANVKVQVWKRLRRDLDLDAALSFMKRSQAEELSRIERMRNTPFIDPPESWISALQEFHAKQCFSQGDLANELGVSQAFVSDLLSGKKECSWSVKLYLWRDGGFALTLEGLLRLFLKKEVTQIAANAD